MRPRPHARYWKALLLVVGSSLLTSGLWLPRASGQRSQGQPPPQQKQEKPSGRIFTGKITLANSHQDTATAGAGFKGVGADGQVEKAVLSSHPDGGAQQKVTQLAAFKVTEQDVAAFVQQGGLRSPSGRTGRR